MLDSSLCGLRIGPLQLNLPRPIVLHRIGHDNSDRYNDIFDIDGFEA